MSSLQPILTSLPTLAIATVYCLWHGYHLVQQRRQRDRIRRERVAWMLWVMATELEFNDEVGVAPEDAEGERF